MKRPVLLIVIGILFILGGAETLWKIVTGLFTLNFYIDPTFCLFFVGIGLLMLKPSSRRWAIFWIVLGYIGCAAIAISLLFTKGHIRVNDLETDGVLRVAVILCATAIPMGFLAWMHRTLKKPEIVALFEKSE